jgi:hypothetical protein
MTGDFGVHNADGGKIVPISDLIVDEDTNRAFMDLQCAKCGEMFHTELIPREISMPLPPRKLRWFSLSKEGGAKMNESYNQI